MSDISDWFKTIPVFTRYWFGSTIALTLIGRFGIVSPYTLILLYEPFLKKFQIWRPLTALFYYPLSPQTGFHFLINLYFLYTYSKRLEEDHFSGRPSDYLFMLLFNWICCVTAGLIIGMPLLMDAMILSVLYVWCQLNKDTIVTFWFGTRFKAMYLPWVLFGFNMILNGMGLTELIGIIIGHLYFFLKFKYPQELGGPVLLDTPSVLKQWFPDRIGGVHTFGMAPRRPQTGTASGNRNSGSSGLFGRRNLGQGHVLGGS
ncbi:derlin-1 [Harmonia axyridis]|uniref:derlin-1 n=1 Tax=Harmonia axyridis TaxID=115357 RepID=UPI001E277214|nr:derlin-1 [Harmonia axyridis]